MNKYQERIVAFIDILGFKELIKSLKEKELFKIFNTIQIFQDLRTIRSLYGNMKFHHFSDTIIISLSINDCSEIMHFLGLIQLFSIRLLQHGILVRGGISQGKLIHTNKEIFGPALIEAYEMESKIANVPRILISKSIIEYLNLKKRSLFVWKQYTGTTISEN